MCPELPKAYYQLFQNEKLKLLKEKWLEKANAYKTKIHRISSVHNILHCSDRSKYFRAHITYHLPHHCTHQQGIPSSRTHTTSYFKREPLLGQISLKCEVKQNKKHGMFSHLTFNTRTALQNFVQYVRSHFIPSTFTVARINSVIPNSRKHTTSYVKTRCLFYSRNSYLENANPNKKITYFLGHFTFMLTRTALQYLRSHFTPSTLAHQMQYQHRYLENGNPHKTKITHFTLSYSDRSIILPLTLHIIYLIVAPINSSVSRTPEGIRTAMSKREACVISEKNRLKMGTQTKQKLPYFLGQLFTINYPDRFKILTTLLQ